MDKILAVDKEHRNTPQHLQQSVNQLVFLPQNKAWQRPAPHAPHVLIKDKTGKNQRADKTLTHLLHLLCRRILLRYRCCNICSMHSRAKAQLFNAGNNRFFIYNAFIKGNVRIIFQQINTHLLHALHPVDNLFDARRAGTAAHARYIK